jgi:hypothetical protein
VNPGAIAAAVWLPVSVIAALAVGRWMRGPQTPAPGPCPATPPAGRQQETQPLPPAPASPARENRPVPPAPGPPLPRRHTTALRTVTGHYGDGGRLEAIERGYACGCTHWYSPAGCLITAEPCAPPPDDRWDDAFREELAE